MDLRLLEIFCCVYEERSFSRAAERLGLSQPTVSGHVKTLEKGLRTPLFDRLGREIVPTAAGRLLFRHGSRVAEIKKAAVHAMDRFLDRLEGDLYLGASTIPGEYLLASPIGQFRADFPGVDVHLRIRDSREIVDAVAAGEVELGFVGARLPGPRLEYRPYASDRLILVAPPTPAWDLDVLPLAELAERPLLVREEGSGTRLMLERRLGELGTGLDELRVVAELGSTTAVKEAVKRGLGASMLSAVAVEDDLEAGWVRQVYVPEIGTLQRGFFTVVDTGRSLSPLVEAFLELLAAEAEQVA